MKLVIKIMLLVMNLHLFTYGNNSNFLYPTYLNLGESGEYYKDILYDYKEIPSSVYKRGYLKRFLSSPIAKELRADLGNFRDEMINKFYEESNKENADYITLSKEITERYVDWIRKYMMTVIPKDIKQDDFAVIAFGSIARQEIAGPYTDLEAAILLPDFSLKSMRIGRRIAERMSYRFNQTGENPKFPMHKKGFRPDEEANFPFNLAMHAKDKSIPEVYCLAFKSFGPKKLANHNGFDIAELEKEYAQNLYPFEGSLAFITTPANMAQYYTLSRYEIPFPLQLNKDSKISEWYLFANQFTQNIMLKPQYIYQQLKNGSCVKDIGSDQDIEEVAQNISDKMLTKELEVMSGFDSIGRNTFHLFGNKKLYDDYQEQTKKILDNEDNLRENAMVKILHGLILKFRKDRNGGQMFLLGNMPDPTDVKRVLYRFEEQVWSTIARLYDLPYQNIRDILNELVNIGLITENFANNRIELLNNAIGIRWRETIMVGEQLSVKQNYLSKKTYIKAINDIEKKIRTINVAISKNKKNTKFLEEKFKLTKQYNILKVLNPEAKNPAFPKKDLYLWINKYSKMSQDLFRRLIYFIGGIDNLEQKKYQIVNQDAFLDHITPPKIDINILKNIN